MIFLMSRIGICSLAFGNHSLNAPHFVNLSIHLERNTFFGGGDTCFDNVTCKQPKHEKKLHSVKGFVFG